MNPDLEPTVTAYSPLFELRAWRRDLGRLQMQYADDDEALATIAKARREVDGWIEAHEQR